MSYRYLYHVRVTRSDCPYSEYLQQLRNEPITGEFYRDVLRWSLSDACPALINGYNASYTGQRAPDKWVQCFVYRAEGPFEEFPTPTLLEEDMTPVAWFRWDYVTLQGGEVVLRKAFTDLRPDYIKHCIIVNGKLASVYGANYERSNNYV